MDGKRILLVSLFLITLVIAGVAIYAGIQLQGTPTISPTPAAAACQHTGRYYCRSLNPSVCPATSSSNPVFNAMVGSPECVEGGTWDTDVCLTNVNFYDACAPLVAPNSECTGNYSSLTTPIIRISTGEEDNGSFVGCSATDPQLNCFCPDLVDVGSTFTSGLVTCTTDRNSDSCGSKVIVEVTDTPTPTPTPTPTLANTDTPTPTPTLVNTDTPTPTPTASTSVTQTPTASPSSSPSPTPTSSVTPTPMSSVTATVTPTSSPIPTTVPTLPPTALVSETFDRVIIALVLVTGGAYLYLSAEHARKR